MAYYDPFADMLRVQRDINRLFNDMNHHYDTAATPYALEVLLDAVPRNPAKQSAQQQQQQQQLQQQGSNNASENNSASSANTSTALATPWNTPSRLLMPRLDVWNEDKQTKIKMEVPGFSKDKINIELVDGMLQVSGEVKEEQEKTEGQRLIHSERRFGSFKRMIRLPEHIKEDEIQAGFENGLLTITVPHAEPPKEQRRQISIA